MSYWAHGAPRQVSNSKPPLRGWHNRPATLTCAGNQSSINCSGDPAARGFQFSFSFGNGFQGTDVIGNSLYVMAYAVDMKK